MIKTTKLITRASGARVILFISNKKCELIIDEVTKEVDKYFCALCDAFVGALERLADRAADASFYKAYLDVECCIEGDVLAFSRSVKVVLDGKCIVKNTSETKFKIVADKCLKRLKNSKKQRFIPSRNSKNIR